MLKLLFLRPGKLGDLIVATPLFRAIKSQNNEVFIAVACSPYNEIIIRNNKHVDLINITNYHSLFSVIRLILWIRKQKFDWVFDLTPGFSRTSTIISRLVRSSVTRTAGMHKGKYAKYFDKVTDYNQMHIIDRNKLLVENVLHCRFDGEFNPDIFYTENHEKRALQLLDKFNYTRKLIGINCSAGEESRQWRKENYSLLIKQINQHYPDYAIVLFSVNEQNSWAQQFKKEMTNVLAVTGVDLLTVAAVIKRLILFITPDTSLLHIASGFKVPVVGLYCVGGENLLRWRAYGTLNKELVAQNTENVNEISTDNVFNALCELLNTLERKCL